ncbi:MAG: N-ethylmaleimide reductase [Acidobacteria bacterium]|nr:N-ethylmaleimide reductase [Acidobacteriota bacterium]
MNDALFQPLRIGPYDLPHRVLMAPLTRSRAQQPGDAPWDLNVEYYRQRSSASLILTEATQVSPRGKGYANTPGIYSDEQVAGWKRVTEVVHANGGRIFAQLWHVGRISHPALQPDGELPVAPSSIRPNGQTYIEIGKGRVDIPTPRALAADELPGIVEDYRRAARNALRAGFDGVQLHGANGYLIDQFLRNGSNQRNDEYGGSVENRMRFPLAVVDALIEELGPERVAVRVSPVSGYNDMQDSDPGTVFAAFAAELSRRRIAFLEIVRMGAAGGPLSAEEEAVVQRVEEAFDGVLVANGHFDADSAAAFVAAGRADAVSFGRMFIANPDLPERIRNGVRELNEPQPKQFYGGGPEGYVDYPTIH